MAELRRESKRVGTDELNEWSVLGDHVFTAAYVEVSGGSRSKARRRMFNLLRALPDGALKDG